MSTNGSDHSDETVPQGERTSIRQVRGALTVLLGCPKVDCEGCLRLIEEVLETLPENGLVLDRDEVEALWHTGLNVDPDPALEAVTARLRRFVLEDVGT